MFFHIFSQKHNQSNEGPKTKGKQTMMNFYMQLIKKKQIQFFVFQLYLSV